MPTLQDVFRCDHPVALITGSGSPRVGRTIARRLAKLGCGIALGLLRGNVAVIDKGTFGPEIEGLAMNEEVLITVAGTVANGLNAKDAVELLRKTDSDRRDYVSNAFDRDITDPLAYDCVLNTTRLTCEDVARMLVDHLQRL